MCLWELIRRVVRLMVRPWVSWCISLLALSCLCGGCSDKIQPPSTAQIIEFENAGPSGPSVDLDRVAKARLVSGPYRVVPGDVLQLEMPRILDPHTLETTTAMGGKETYACRVADAGTIVLPVVGPLAVAGKSLAEIESAIIAIYYPKYVKTEPLIYVSVLEYKTHRVSVVGAVAQPGIYPLRHDQTTLVGLLMEAGGIVDEGAAIIRINRSGQTGVRRLGTPPRSSSQSLVKTTAAQYLLADFSGPSVRSIGARPPVAGIGPEMIFIRDGSLNTTGWLVLQEADEVIARKWLDLGSPFQRRTFLQALAVRLGLSMVADIESRLSELAQLLDSHPVREGVHLAAHASQWSTTEAGRLTVPSNRLAARRFPVHYAAAVPVAETPGNDPETTVVLPVRGMNIPFADVVLQDGDSIVVEPPQEQFVSVLGLVTKAGNFPYPPDVRYTLVQAIAFAGGLDLTADPRYVSVYRLKADGTVAGVTYQLIDPENQEQLTEALALPLKPGDVVSVEQTPRTRTNTFLDRVFRVSLGLYFRPESIWGEDD